MPLAVGVLVAAALGCNWNFGTNSNSSTNSNASNTANTNRNSSDDFTSSSPTPDPNRDMTPLDMTVSEMVEGSGDTDKEGRRVTVTGGVLENLDSNALRIRAPYGGAAFYCYGDFIDYMSMSEKVRSLAQSGRSPKVTVKGIYKVASVGTGGELSPCVLSDIEKP